MKSSIKELARAIIQSEERVDLFLLHEHYGLSPSEALRAASFFVRLGLGKIEEGFLIFFPAAKEFIVSRRAKFFLESGRLWDREWAGLDASKPYLPDLRKVNRRFFTRHIDLTFFDDKSAS